MALAFSRRRWDRSWRVFLSSVMVLACRRACAADGGRPPSGGFHLIGVDVSRVLWRVS